jgi:hypothetical protein
MPLSWGETWIEHVSNALAIHYAREQKPTCEDLKAIRSRLRRAIVEIDREIAAGPLREVR